jgi:hypothetical protein
MKEIIEKYIEVFGEKPNIIGLFWNDQKTLEENIKDAIKSGKKYNELDLLTEKEKESYLKGDLLF